MKSKCSNNEIWRFNSISKDPTTLVVVGFWEDFEVAGKSFEGTKRFGIFTVMQKHSGDAAARGVGQR